MVLRGNLLKKWKFHCGSFTHLSNERFLNGTLPAPAAWSLPPASRHRPWRMKTVKGFYGLWWSILRSKKKVQNQNPVMFGGTFRMSKVSCPPVPRLISRGMELSPRADTRPDPPIHCLTLHGSLKKHILQQIWSTPKIMVQVCRDINKHHSSHQLMSSKYPTWITCQITAKLPSLNYQIRVRLTWLPPSGPSRRTAFHGILQVLWGLRGKVTISEA